MSIKNKHLNISYQDFNFIQLVPAIDKVLLGVGAKLMGDANASYSTRGKNVTDVLPVSTRMEVYARVRACHKIFCQLIYENVRTYPFTVGKTVQYSYLAATCLYLQTLIL